MTVSWPWRLASISGAAGGEFDDGCVVDRWDWLAIGRSLDGRSWHPDGPEFRQDPDSLGYGRGVHGGDHAQPLGGCSGTEENSIAAWPWCRGGSHGSSKRPARSGTGKRRFLIQPRPAIIGRRRPCRGGGALLRGEPAILPRLILVQSCLPNRARFRPHCSMIPGQHRNV